MLRGIEDTVPRDLGVSTAIRTDVIIIGAGAAGLTAARDLIKDGWNVQILEASDKIGGRLKKEDQLADFPLDLGAEWIHVDPEILDFIADEDVTSQLNIEKYDPQLYEYYTDGHFYPYDYTSDDHKFIDYTWYDFFNDHIADSFLNDNIINYNCKVNRVDDRYALINVKCDDQRTFKSDYVIVAVPLTVLQDGDITFIPDLSDVRKDALKLIDMPPVIKVFLKFSEKFYFDGFEYTKDYDVKIGERYFYDAGLYQPTSDFVLGVFAIGDPAMDYMNLENDNDVKDALLSELDVMFDGKATASFTGSYVVQNWEKEPYIRGSYSYYENGYRPLRQVAKPIYDYIFFAGEYAPVDWEHGFAHGAAISGKAAAYQVTNGKKSAYFLCQKFRGIEC